MIRDFSDSLVEEFNNFNVSDIIIFDDIRNIDLTYEAEGDYPELTEAQKEVTAYKLEDFSVSAILNSLQVCNNINQNDYYKTLKFLKKHNLTKEDCLDIIKQLTVADYYLSIKSTAEYHYGNNLIIFKPKNIRLSDGRALENIVLYIKIDLDDTSNEAIALVSFHEDKKDGE